MCIYKGNWNNFSFKMNKRDSSDRKICFGFDRPKLSMDTNVFSDPTPRMIEMQSEIQDLTK